MPSKDVASMTEEELRNLMDFPPEEEQEVPPEQEEVIQQEQETDDSEEQEQDTEPDHTEEEESAPEEPAPPQEKSEVEFLRLEIERLKVLADQAEHYRKLHDKLAGEYGNLKRRFKESDRTRRDGSDDYDSNEELEEIRSELERIKSAERRRSEEEASRALAEEAQAFVGQYPDVKDYADKIRGYLNERYSLVQEALEAADPTHVRSVTRNLIREAYFSAREESLREQLAAAKEKRVEQAKSLKERKLAAAPSAPSGARTSAKKPQVSLKDMPIDELKKLVDSV